MAKYKKGGGAEVEFMREWFRTRIGLTLVVVGILTAVALHKGITAGDVGLIVIGILAGCTFLCVLGSVIIDLLKGNKPPDN